MSQDGHGFVEWKEQYVSQERGNRVVHYLLKNSSGDFILAVVGTERSLRHMVYVVADEFLNAYGAESSIQVGFKWRSKREVVDWLTSMLSKQHIDQSTSLDSAQALGSPKFPVTGFIAPQTHVVDCMGRLAMNLKGHNSDILWSGVAWTCGKQLKHYPAFCRNGTMIATHSFVFVMAKEENHYLAYLEDMYEDKKGQKKVKVRWFHHNQEVKGVIPLRTFHPKEVFITPYAQVISAECVDGSATILTREHYEKCIAFFPQASFSRIHLCCRQFRNNRVKPFSMTKLRGYLDQPILSCLSPNPFSKEDGDFNPRESGKQGGKRTRSCRGRERLVTDHSSARVSGRGSRTVVNKQRSCWSLKYRVFGRSVFKVDEKIELLCQDSGLRGCWFRCTVLQVSGKQMKVQYDDVQDEDGCGNLQEWIPCFRLAMNDRLGLRCSGRPMIRPTPPNTQTDIVFEVGTPVDAWWSDGWWEAVVTGGLDNSGDDTLQLYIPGESLFLNVQKTNLRVSRDWVGSQWFDIKPKPEILLLISESISPETKLSTPNTTKEPKSNGFLVSCHETLISTRLNTVEEENPEEPVSTSSDDLMEDEAQCVNNGENANEDNDMMKIDVVDELKAIGQRCELELMDVGT